MQPFKLQNSALFFYLNFPILMQKKNKFLLRNFPRNQKNRKSLLQSEIPEIFSFLSMYLNFCIVCVKDKKKRIYGQLT